MYGIGEPIPDEVAKKMVFVPMSRSRINILGVCFQIVVAPLFFMYLYYVQCFRMHYDNPQLVFGLQICGFAIATILAVYAYIRRVIDASPSWHTIGAGSLFVACGVSFFVGNFVFFKYTYNYYRYSDLGSYVSLDPVKVKGAMIADAGRMYFTGGAYLDLKHSMGFKHGDMYCVAPINGKTNYSTPNLDVWAVGKNCCNNWREGNAYKCGDWNNPHTRSALRSMDIDDNPFYRLAVQQAEAAYGFTATHPIFVIWTQDPVDEMDRFLRDGMKYYGMFSLAYFVANFGFVCQSIFLFSKMNVRETYYW